MTDMFQAFDVLKCTPGCGIYGHHTVPLDAHYVKIYVALVIQFQGLVTLVREFLADRRHICHIGCHPGIAAQFWKIFHQILQHYAFMHGSDGIGRAQMHHYPDVIAMLAHLALKTKMQWKLAAGTEIAAEIILLNHFGTVSHDTHFFEHIVLHFLLANARRRDVKMISIVVSDANITISAGDPVPMVCFYQSFAYGF